jgi:hypothetical protein
MSNFANVKLIKPFNASVLIYFILVCRYVSLLKYFLNSWSKRLRNFSIFFDRKYHMSNFEKQFLFLL